MRPLCLHIWTQKDIGKCYAILHLQNYAKMVCFVHKKVTFLTLGGLLVGYSLLSRKKFLDSFVKNMVSIVHNEYNSSYLPENEHHQNTLKSLWSSSRIWCYTWNWFWRDTFVIVFDIPWSVEEYDKSYPWPFHELELEVTKRNHKLEPLDWMVGKMA